LEEKPLWSGPLGTMKFGKGFEKVRNIFGKKKAWGAVVLLVVLVAGLLAACGGNESRIVGRWRKAIIQGMFCMQ